MAIASGAKFSFNFVTCILLATLFYICTCLERELVGEVNPGCPEHICSNGSVVKVVHVRAEGPNDTLHHVWCFHPKPTVLIALTSRETKNVTIDWNNFPNITSSLYFSPQPIYSFGILLNQIYEFNDVEDTGFLNMTNNNESYVRKIEMPDTWKILNGTDFVQNFGSVHLVMEGSWKQNNSFVMEGVLKVELETFRQEGHGPQLPHLFHSPNATQMELSMLNMLTKSGFKQARFAVELVMAGNESAIPMQTRSFQSLDDEHTPGIFTLVDIQTHKSLANGSGGYLQWRPVAYVADERDIVNSTESAIYEVQNVTASTCDGTLLSAFFGTHLNTSLLNAVNVSFGAKDDGFYALNNASIWTVTIGYGHPPDEKFSLLVILIMSLCLGLPAVLIFLSGLYIIFRRISHRKDDLLLSE